MEDPFVDWLLEHGYRVEHLTASEGSVCLIHDGDERWVGWGETAETALANTLALMFPSRAAREALELASEASSSVSTEVVDSEDASESATPREVLAPEIVEVPVEASQDPSGELDRARDEVLERRRPSESKTRRRSSPRSASRTAMSRAPSRSRSSTRTTSSRSWPRSPIASTPRGPSSPSWRPSCNGCT